RGRANLRLLPWRVDRQEREDPRAVSAPGRPQRAVARRRTVRAREDARHETRGDRMPKGRHTVSGRDLRPHRSTSEPLYDVDQGPERARRAARGDPAYRDA